MDFDTTVSSPSRRSGSGDCGVTSRHAMAMLCAAVLFATPGCAVVAVGAAVVSTAATVAGTAVDVGVGAVKVTGKAIGRGIDVVTGSPPKP